MTRIRRAQENDLPSMVTLERECFPESPWSQALISGALADRDTVCLVASEAHDVLAWGAVLSAQGAGEADILTVGVDTAHRGKGCGRALLLALCTAAASRGARMVFLEVRVDNVPALGLYRAVGFTEVGRRPRYYQPGGVDAIVMRRALPVEQRSGGSA